MILEIGKSYIEHFYNGNLQECLQKRDGIVWTPERIKAAFNNGEGTEKDLKRHIENNKKYAYFLKVDKWRKLQ